MLSILRKAAVFVIAFTSFAGAQDAQLTRHWQHHFWIMELVDLRLDVYQLPNGTVRVAGQFSNGQRLINSEPAGLVYIDDGDGTAIVAKIAEWVPMTRGGGTNVRSKQHDFFTLSSPLDSVRAVAYESATQFQVGVKLSCDGTGSRCSGSINYEKFPDRIPKDLIDMTRMEDFDFCQGFNPESWRAPSSRIVTTKTCDASSGTYATVTTIFNGKLEDGEYEN